MTDSLGNACSGLDAATLAELEAIAKLHNDANGWFMRLVNTAGSAAGSVFDRLPDDWKARLSGASEAALRRAFAAARASQPRDTGPAALRRASAATTGERWHRYASAATGALGGAGGLATTLVDLPVTTTLILRSIQQIAADYGEDPANEAVRAQCIAVFALGGPMADDDDKDMGLWAARMALTGKAAADMIRIAAPRFGIVLSEKMLAQTTPVLGALAGAAINPTFVGYYQKMAHVHFRLRRLERDADGEQLRACFERLARRAKG